MNIMHLSCIKCASSIGLAHNFNDGILHCSLTYTRMGRYLIVREDCKLLARVIHNTSEYRKPMYACATMPVLHSISLWYWLCDLLMKFEISQYRF